LSAGSNIQGVQMRLYYCSVISICFYFEGYPSLWLYLYMWYLPACQNSKH